MGIPTTMVDAVGGAPKVNGNTMNRTLNSYAAKHDLPTHFIGGNELSQAPPSKVKDFVAANDGHTVITNVSNPQQKLQRVSLELIESSTRSSLQTTVSPQSKRSDPSEDGLTRPLATSVPFNSLSWLLLKIWLPTQTTSGWQTNMLRYVYSRLQPQDSTRYNARSRVLTDIDRFLAVPTTTIMPTSNSLSMLQSVWASTLCGLDGKFFLPNGINFLLARN